jgi:hypothetical protein
MCTLPPVPLCLTLRIERIQGFSTSGRSLSLARWLNCPRTLVALAQSRSLVPAWPTAQTSGAAHNESAKTKCTDNGTYVNSNGQTVPRPENCSTVPQGATAQCRDGTYSSGKSRRGTCSHHGGVAKWL